MVQTFFLSIGVLRLEALVSISLKTEPAIGSQTNNNDFSSARNKFSSSLSRVVVVEVDVVEVVVVEVVVVVVTAADAFSSSPLKI